VYYIYGDRVVETCEAYDQGSSAGAPFFAVKRMPARYKTKLLLCSFPKISREGHWPSLLRFALGVAKHSLVTVSFKGRDMPTVKEQF